MYAKDNLKGEQTKDLTENPISGPLVQDGYYCSVAFRHFTLYLYTSEVSGLLNEYSMNFLQISCTSHIYLFFAEACKGFPFQLHVAK
jgi:hypothetical protein